jgi:hypothetical protein
MPEFPPALPKDAGAAAEFIVRYLYRPIYLTANARYFAVAETENTNDDGWFWSDDNAKILEFMSQPELRQRFPGETLEILRFVRSMCDGPFIFRRVSAPRLERVGGDRGIARYRHSLLRLGFDPAQGAITAGIRFHDERDADNLTLCGNYVEFTHRGRRCREYVPTSSDNAGAEQTGHVLRLHAAAELHFTSGWRRRRLGKVAYTYIFDARSMLFDVEAVLEIDPAIEVRDVVLTIGHGALDHCLFNSIVTDTSPGATPLYAAGVPSARSFDAAGASYYAILQGHISADSLAIHSLPRAPQRLSGIDTVVATQGRLGSVVARYEFPGVHRGARLVAAEHKLITAGGCYDRIADYAALLRRALGARGAQTAACDFSISYDYGVTINAFAKCFASGIDPTSRGELRALFDATLQHYCELYIDQHATRPAAIFSRELAFAVLGTATMYRTTGSDDYRRRLELLCEVLLGFAAPAAAADGAPAMAFLMRKDNPRAYLDCHSAALLALTQAARISGAERLASVIERGLSAYRLAPQAIECGASGTLDTLGVAMPRDSGTGISDTAMWNFKAGLTLRFFAALRHSPDRALQAIVARHGERIFSFEAVLRRQLAQSIAERDGCIEFRTSVLSGETNSETQPWVMLGLLGHPLD